MSNATDTGTIKRCALLGVSALQDITNANALMDCLDGDENSSLYQPDESCDLKLKIQEALGAIIVSYHQITFCSDEKCQSSIQCNKWRYFNGIHWA